MKRKVKRLLVLVLALSLFTSINTMSVLAGNNKERSVAQFNENKEVIELRAGGGSGVRYVTAPTTFTINVSGSGMHYIRVEVSGTDSNNVVYGSVTPPSDSVFNYRVQGNNSSSKWYLLSLPAGTYEIYAVPLYGPAVVAVYVE